MMKKLFSLLFWPLFFTADLSAQKPDCPRLFAVIPAGMNVLYIGVDNPVQISVTGAPEDSLEVTISQGTITRIGKGFYSARVSMPGAITITISSKDKKTKI